MCFILSNKSVWKGEMIQLRKGMFSAFAWGLRATDTI